MKTALLLFFVASVNTSFAQKTSWVKSWLHRAPYDTSYVESYYDHFLHVTAVSNLQTSVLKVAGNSSSKPYDYLPNNVYRFGLGLDYKFMSLEYTFQLDDISKPDATKGKTSSLGLRMGITGRRLLASALIQNISGMYLNNPKDFVMGWQASTHPYPVRSDIQVTTVLGSVNYFFNHTKYSTMASLWQIDRQKKSAGSFTAGIASSFYFIRADSALGFYPQTQGGSLAPVRDVANYLYGINFGYSHNFIFNNKFFANIFIIPGVNLQFGKEHLTDGKIATYTAQPGVHGDIRMVAGYNGDWYYIGIHYANYFLFSKLKTNTSIDMYHEYVRIFIGRRFDMRMKKKQNAKLK